MHDSPGSVVTQLCSGLQLYSAERRIADCILADVKWASVATSAELAKASHSSEATVTRLCHKLGYANYRKFQLEPCTGCAGAAGNGGPQKAPQ